MSKKKSETSYKEAIIITGLAMVLVILTIHFENIRSLFL